LKAAADANAVTAIAKEAGFSISADDLTNAQSELSGQELEGVAGGRIITIRNWEKCWF
ncbi:Nif11-like leader peptide family RiPP precursor, partial [Synechococcus sp. AH-551-N17]|nr:Nif11-like leader peptide family RiPP precursor [Synechococcus sp. AH-551-N17]